MIRRALHTLLSASLLALVACATQPSKPPSAKTPASSPPLAETSVESNPADASVDLTPVEFAVARADFVRDTAKRFGIDAGYIDRVLAQAVYRDDVVALMSKPAERVKPWNEYRARMLTDARIASGREFFATHRAELQRVYQRTGVPGEIITAIVGVETSYGGFTGKHRVLDALYTLAFYYPRSGDPAKAAYEQRRELFFRDELAQLFALAREEKLDILSVTGSYAGAMGMGQFMPSSYREFAVDGDGDGRRDLFDDYDDIFSSIANYFVKKGGEQGGWVRDGVVAAQAALLPGHEEFNPTDWLPVYTLEDLAARGYRPLQPVAAGLTATPVTLQASDGKQYWFGFRNYYAITRYNNSKMYAMAVYQLSQAILGQELPPA
ncbi:lytic murein transglycosylase B [Pseudoxanthomonas helianthi]|uniref:Lytic murein transglycosylase B n=1 Tax=Pseudoxanthomonas helianthi TaxID=1453541 RepID=A0A941AUB0_9GAMM|nr:lytic murein transglycosylase B [Pseudoxanthomonas helianthi]MBP3984242.1 lytic murein transglycosylase B [Pseudoxanthomonas helianthi]